MGRKKESAKKDHFQNVQINKQAEEPVTLSKWQRRSRKKKLRKLAQMQDLPPVILDQPETSKKRKKKKKKNKGNDQSTSNGANGLETFDEENGDYLNDPRPLILQQNDGDILEEQPDLFAATSSSISMLQLRYLEMQKYNPNDVEQSDEDQSGSELDHNDSFNSHFLSKLENSREDNRVFEGRKIKKPKKAKKNKMIMQRMQRQ